MAFADTKKSRKVFRTIWNFPLLFQTALPTHSTAEITQDQVSYCWRSSYPCSSFSRSLLQLLHERSNNSEDPACSRAQSGEDSSITHQSCPCYCRPFSYNLFTIKTGQLRWTDQLTLLPGCSRTLCIWQSEIIFLLGCKPAFTLKTFIWEQVPHVLFRHREAFPFYFLVLENFGTLLDFGDLKKESRWTVWGPQLFRKDSPCTCKCHFSVKTMTEIYIKWAVNEVREKLGYLKTRAPPIILRTYYTWERRAWKSLAGCDSLSTLLAPSSRYLENSGSCKLLNPLLSSQGADR